MDWTSAIISGLVAIGAMTILMTMGKRMGIQAGQAPISTLPEAHGKRNRPKAKARISTVLRSHPKLAQRLRRE